MFIIIKNNLVITNKFHHCYIYLVLISILFSSGCGARADRYMQGSIPNMKTSQSIGTQMTTLNPSEKIQKAQSQWIIRGQVKVEVKDNDAFSQQLTKKLKALNQSLSHSAQDKQTKQTKQTKQSPVFSQIINQELNKRYANYSLNIKLRVHPQHVESLLQWIRKQGMILQEKVTRSEVGQEILDHQIKLKNKRLTLQRLRHLLKQEGHKVQDILQIEKEMMRVRETIESDLGRLRWLSDQVERASITLHIIQKKVYQASKPSKYAKFYLTPRMSMLHADQTQQWGGGLSLINPKDAASVRLDFNYFQKDGQQPQTIMTTIGVGSYSDFLGKGHNRFFNPYLSVHFGHIYRDFHAFLIGAEVGVELFKNKYFFTNLKGQGLGMLGQSSHLLILAGLELGVVY